MTALAAYCNSFQGPFIFDDASITDNPAIRSLRSLDTILLPAVNKSAVDRRPVVNLSLAINYAVGGTAVWGYHVFNLAAHILAAWTLLGVVRRTLLSPRLRDSLGTVALPLAVITTVVWTVHPLLTNAVTYVIQRTEILAGLFYLLTLYCVIRGSGNPHPGKWYAAAVAACLLAMGSKESATSAPVVVMLYDRIFLAGSWREVWRRRRGLYLGLAATWSLPAFLLLRHWTILAQAEGGGAAPPRAWLDYALLQFRSVTWYLKLSFWPSPLILDYGPDSVHSFREVVPYAACMFPLGIGTIMALRWRPALGFLGVWFFAILAPSSGLIPITPECAAEKRMYLPLAAVVVLATASVYLLGKRWLSAGGALSPGRVALARRLAWGATAAVVVALILRSVQRNEDYRSDLAIWQDTAAKAPGNPLAHYNLGNALARRGRSDEAIACLEQAIELKPGYRDAHNNLAVELMHKGRIDEAIGHYRQALEGEPDLAHLQASVRLQYLNIHKNLGGALARRGRIAEAATHFRKTLEIQPDDAGAQNNLGGALADHGQVEEAIPHFRKALEIQPDNAEAAYNLGVALSSRGQLEEAIADYRKALEIQPDYVPCSIKLGDALRRQGKLGEGIAAYRRALQFDAGCPEAHYRLGNALMQQGRFAEAARHYQQYLASAPEDANGHFNLGMALYGEGLTSAAMLCWHEALRLQPEQVTILTRTAWVLAAAPETSIRSGAEAVVLAQRAVHLTRNQSAECFDCLAAAYAEAGRFAEAVAAADRAMQLLSSAPEGTAAKQIQARLASYKLRRAWRTTFAAGPRPSPSSTGLPTY